MIRILAWLMIIMGSVVLAFNGYKYWGGINVAVKDPEIAVKIADDWQETEIEPSLTSVEEFSEEDQEEKPEVEKEFQPILDKYLRPQDPNPSDDPNDEQDQTESQDNEKSEEEQPQKEPKENNASENTGEQTAPEDSTDKKETKKPPRKKTTPNPSSDLKVGSVIGQLIIPKIGAYLPIVEGTDPNSLEKGVGKYRGYGTVAPDQTGHVVLSGHRDTVFRKVGKLVNGDKMYVKFKNKMYTYQIRKTWVTHAKDRTVIVPINRPVLSVTTCYPFDYVGDAPDRYIIRADLTKIQKI